MSNSKLEIYQGSRAPDSPDTRAFDWRWRVRAANGEIVASGESYTRKEDAERGYRDATLAMIGAGSWRPEDLLS